MNSDMAELYAELPDDMRSSVRESDELQELLATLTKKPVPAGRVLRLWNLGTLQARLALAYGFTWLRERGLNDAERAALRDGTHLKSAMKLFESMGYMRGAVVDPHHDGHYGCLLSAHLSVSNRCRTLCQAVMTASAATATSWVLLIWLSAWLYPGHYKTSPVA